MKKYWKMIEAAVVVIALAIAISVTSVSGSVDIVEQSIVLDSTAEELNETVGELTVVVITPPETPTANVQLETQSYVLSIVLGGSIFAVLVLFIYFTRKRRLEVNELRKQLGED